MYTIFRLYLCGFFDLILEFYFEFFIFTVFCLCIYVTFYVFVVVGVLHRNYV